MSEPGNIHGTAIAVAGRAVLIRGASGSGKSDLALRCLAVGQGAFAVMSPLLVADDRVVMEVASNGVIVRAPDVLRGLIEVRGVGIVTVPSVERAQLALVVDLVEPAAVDRMPEPGRYVEICGASIPAIVLAPFEPSAPLKVLIALARAAAAGAS